MKIVSALGFLVVANSLAVSSKSNDNESKNDFGIQPIDYSHLSYNTASAPNTTIQETMIGLLKGCDQYFLSPKDCALL